MTAEHGEPGRRPEDEFLQGCLTFAVQQRDDPTPRNPDPTMKALYDTIAERSEADDPIITEMFSYLSMMHASEDTDGSERHPIDTVNHLYKVIIALAAPQGIRDLQQLEPLTRMTSTRDWHRAIDRVHDSENYFERFMAYAMMPVNSNVSARGELIEATALLHGVDKPGRIIEMGASMKHILKRLRLLHEPEHESLMRWDHTDVLRRPNRPDEPTDRLIDHVATEHYRQMLRGSGFLAARATGVDLFDADRDPIFRQFGIICSHKPGELHDQLERERFGRLLNTDVPSVDFLFADVTTARAEEFGEPADLTVIPTMLYMHRRTAIRRSILNLAMDVTQPDGKIVLIDKIRMNSNGSSYVFPRWDWNYNVWVYDKARAEDGWSHNFSANGTRVESIVLRDGAKRAKMAEHYGLTD